MVAKSERGSRALFGGRPERMMRLSIWSRGQWLAAENCAAAENWGLQFRFEGARGGIWAGFGRADCAPARFGGWPVGATCQCTVHSAPVLSAPVLVSGGARFHFRRAPCVPRPSARSPAAVQGRVNQARGPARLMYSTGAAQRPAPSIKGPPGRGQTPNAASIRFNFAPLHLAAGGPNNSRTVPKGHRLGLGLGLGRAGAAVEPPAARRQRSLGRASARRPEASRPALGRLSQPGARGKGWQSFFSSFAHTHKQLLGHNCLGAAKCAASQLTETRINHILRHTLGPIGAPKRPELGALWLSGRIGGQFVLGHAPSGPHTHTHTSEQASKPQPADCH